MQQSSIKNKDNNIVKDFIQHLKLLQYLFGADPYWQLIFSNGKTKWFYLHISLYNNIYYISQQIGESSNIEIHDESELKEGQSFSSSNSFLDTKYWDTVLQFALNHIKDVLKNPLEAHIKLQEHYPMKYRQGTIQKSLLWQFDDSFYRFDRELSQKEIQQYCNLVENGTFSDHSRETIKNLTANVFFDLCKIAYLSGNLKLDAKQKELPGREMYKIFADGRHDGLLDIDGDSVTEFNEWMNQKHPKYTGGGHPWEILRGGNTTHISLYVSKEMYSRENEYKLSLAGHSSSRLSETIKIALGLYNKGYFVSIADADLIRNRLLGQDFIGIVPEYAFLHRAQQLFETKLEDVLYLTDIKSSNKKLLELIQWERLPYNFPRANG